MSVVLSIFDNYFSQNYKGKKISTNIESNFVDELNIVVQVPSLMITSREVIITVFPLK